MCENGHCLVAMWRNGKYVLVCINCNRELG